MTLSDRLNITIANLVSFRIAPHNNRLILKQLVMTGEAPELMLPHVLV